MKNSVAGRIQLVHIYGILKLLKNHFRIEIVNGCKRISYLKNGAIGSLNGIGLFENFCMCPAILDPLIQRVLI